MQVAANIHLGPDTRISAPDWADAFVQVDEGTTDISMFLGPDDETRIANIDKLAEVLLEVRLRCMARLPKEPEITESEHRALHGAK